MKKSEEADRFATVTNYAALYGVGYFAHHADAASFSKDSVPQIVAEYCRKVSARGVVDIGAGSGLFGKLLHRHGITNIDVDVMHREDESYIRCDFSAPDIANVSRISHMASGLFGNDFLITCFDMAEHVDIEHLPDFIYNIAMVMKREGICSISTRPSSRANIFHSTILPIDTWKYLFSLVGIGTDAFAPLQACRSDQQFRSDSQELLAVSAWQKRNMFQDDPAFQHYLHLYKNGSDVPPREDVRARIETVLDTQVRRIKRNLIAGLKLPNLVYLVSFIQDWSFLRSLLEIWPADRVRVLIRNDSIVPAYADIINAYLSRTGVVVGRFENIEGASALLEDWGVASGELFVAATEGLPTLVHGLASLVTLDARKRGMTTVALQHGELVADHTAHAAQFFAAADERSVVDFERSTPSPGMTMPLVLGALKRLDGAIAPADGDAVAFRLRSSSKHYRLRILVGTNLNWSAHDHGRFDVIDWLRAAVIRHPDVMFIIRPHPEDWRVLRGVEALDQHNVIVLDELTMLCIDWPISRILTAVDGVISTHSTLIGDALAGGSRTAIFPTDISDARLLAAERRWMAQGAIILDEAECRSGAIPAAWDSAVDTADEARSRVESERGFRKFLNTLVGLVEVEDVPAHLDVATRQVERSFLESCRKLSLDSHPVASRARISAAISRFISWVED